MKRELYRASAHVEKIKRDRKGAKSIGVSLGDRYVEVTQLSSRDPEGPGHIGIMPRPMSLSLRQVRPILSAAVKQHPLAQTALDRLRTREKVDFFGRDAFYAK